MARALDMAVHAASLDEVPVGAVVVLDDQVVGEGYNQTVRTSDPTAHAEVVALRDAAQRLGNYRLPEASLYVTIEPCAMCAGALVHARIKQLVFGAPEPRAGAVGSMINLLENEALNHRVDVLGNVLADQCSDLMRTFFRNKRLV